MKTLRERSRTTSHNTGTKPFYFHRRPVRQPDWTGSVKLTMALCVALILSLWWAYRTFTN